MIQQKPTPQPSPVVPVAPSSLLDPERIVGWMRAHNCPVETSPSRVNLVYVENCDERGVRNAGTYDHWNDQRCIVQYDTEGKPHLTFSCIATTRPSAYYDRSHIIGWDGKAAAIISVGSQTCWQVGIHHAGGAHEALIQTGAECKVNRDIDKNWTRRPDETMMGWYGINHHSTASNPVTLNSIGGFSAGCCVAIYMRDHTRWMSLLKQDERYVANHDFVFTVTIIPQDWQT